MWALVVARVLVPRLLLKVASLLPREGVRLFLVALVLLEAICFFKGVLEPLVCLVLCASLSEIALLALGHPFLWLEVTSL